MSDVTHILHAIEHGDASEAEVKALYEDGKPPLKKVSSE
jgi:hypothetical protein